MKTLHWMLLMLPGLLQAPTCLSQPVPRTTVVEHFTNTFCSVCASRNPGLYGNLAAFPDVLHISYYPSAPYPACPFNQMNKVEQDARTSFYGIYGTTPRLVINGAAIPANTSYASPSLLQNGLSETSAFFLSVKVSRRDESTGEAVIIIRRVADDALAKLVLYAVVSEDTVLFNANNGEAAHYDKFNKSLTGPLPITVSSPVAIGDSVIHTFSFGIGSGWDRSRVTAILQDENKKGLQAARSAVVPDARTVMPDACGIALCMYPLPARNELRFTALHPGYHRYTISNAFGQVVQQGVVYDIAIPISLSALQSGLYFIVIEDGAMLRRGRFVKL